MSDKKSVQLKQTSSI